MRKRHKSRKRRTTGARKRTTHRRGHARYYAHMRKSFRALHRVLKRHEPGFVRSVVGGR
jgi:hypothetical protein